MESVDLQDLQKSVKVVIPSRGRADTIAQQSLRLFPYATVTVDEEEVDAYAQVMPREQILPHPPLGGLVGITNWIFDNVKSEFLYTIYDDIIGVRCLVGWRVRFYDDPAAIAGLLETTAVCARDAGAFLFGFGHHMNKPFYPQTKPFKLNGYVRNIMGYREGHGLRYDPDCPLHDDVDVALQSLLKHRIMWRDDRWCFDSAPLGTNKGGQVGRRTAAKLQAADEAIVNKWGSHVRVENRRPNFGRGKSNTTATVMRVPRTQPL
jgi:hypothetical protein